MQNRPDAFMVTVIKEPAKEMTVADVIIGSFGITGLLVLLSLVLGAIVGLVLVRWHRWFPPEGDHLPPVSPSVRDRTAAESSQAR